MNKDFINIIQTSSGHTALENGETSHFNDLYVGSRDIISVGGHMSDFVGCVNGINMMDFSINSVVQKDYLVNNLANQSIYKEDFLQGALLDIEVENFRGHIADAGVERNSLSGYCNLNNFYTTPEVAIDEAGGNLSHFIPYDNIWLQSFTPSYFKEHGNTVPVTSPFGEMTTVTLEKENNSTTQLTCGHKLAAYLTNNTTGECVAICYDVLYSGSTNDFSLAVNGIASHTSCNIYTEDSCLGYAFSTFYSFSPRDNIFWKDKIKIKNNSLCSHNH